MLAPAAKVLLVGKGDYVEVDLETGHRTLIADTDQPVWFPKFGPDGTLYVLLLELPNTIPGVYRVDLPSATLTRVIEPGGSFPFFKPRALAVEDTHRVLFTNMDHSQLLRGNPLTGEKSLVSQVGVRGEGTAGAYAEDMALIASNRVVLLPLTSQPILNFADLDTGDRGVFFQRNSGGQRYTAITTDATGSGIYATTGQAICHISSDGVETLIASNTQGTGPDPHNSTLSVIGGTLYALNSSGLMAVDTTTGNRTVIASTEVGEGTPYLGYDYIATPWRPTSLSPLSEAWQLY